MTPRGCPVSLVEPLHQLDLGFTRHMVCDVFDNGVLLLLSAPLPFPALFIPPPLHPALPHCPSKPQPAAPPGLWAPGLLRAVRL